MSIREINFDGIIGPTHNYAGLSFGNVASAANAAMVSRPKDAALQGLAKMSRLRALGLAQGFFLPHRRPAALWLRRLGFEGTDAQVMAAAWKADPGLVRNASSASAMWAANLATVSPATDTTDGMCHLSVANLAQTLHRSIEARQALRQLKVAFADQRHFTVHEALPAGLRDEGAANFMRLASRHESAGVEIFVYGEEQQGGYPARQRRIASEAIARRHRLDPTRTYFARQSDIAIQAGAFHNDVVAVANERVLFTHELAFDDKDGLYHFIRRSVPDAVIIEVPEARVGLGDAISSYLFNSQLVTLPGGEMALVVPTETRNNAAAWGWLQEMVAAGGPITRIEVVEVRESMRNGGGPACLRLRLTVDENAYAAIDRRFLFDDSAADKIATVIERTWPDAIAPDDLGEPDLWARCIAARAALTDALGFADGEL